MAPNKVNFVVTGGFRPSDYRIKWVPSSASYATIWFKNCGQSQSLFRRADFVSSFSGKNTKLVGVVTSIYDKFLRVSKFAHT